MSDASDTNLTIWASSPWLSQAIHERVNSLPPNRKALRRIGKSGKASGPYADEPLVQSLAQATAAIGRLQYESDRHSQALELLRNELVLGAQLAFGQLDDNELSVVELIPRSFWPGASFNAPKNSASRARRTYVEIRVAHATSMHPPPNLFEDGRRSVADEIEPEASTAARAKPGPKSQEHYIRLAIATCPANHPNWPKFNLARRHSAYMRFLETETDADTSLKGFSPKTFEKFEGKIRSGARRKLL